MGQISEDLRDALAAQLLALKASADEMAAILAAAEVIPVEPPPPPPDPDPEPEPDPDPPPPDPDPEPEPDPTNNWEIDGATLRLDPYLPGQTRWKIAARNIGANASFHLTLPADVFEYTFSGPPSSITSKDFQVSMGRVGITPEWDNDWRDISAQTGPTPPPPPPDPEPDPDPAPPPSSGGRVLFERSGPFRVRYPAGSSGGGGNALSGVLGFPSFPPVTAARFEYLFTPEDNFRWSVGGMKLPGLAGGTAPTGGNHNPNGWTFRLQLERESSMPANEAFYVLYLYCISPASNTGGYGTRVTGGGTRMYARAGQQDRVQIDMLRGTPGQANGQAILTVNGVVAARHNSVNWASASAPIAKVQGESFFGGTNNSPQEQFATFSGFRVVEL